MNLRKTGLALACAGMAAIGVKLMYDGYKMPTKPEIQEVAEGDITNIIYPTGQQYRIRTADNSIRKNFIARIERENGKTDTAQIDEFIDDKTSYPDLGVLTRREILEAIAKYNAGFRFNKAPDDVYESQRIYMETKSRLYKELEQLEREKYRQIKEQKMKQIEAEQRYLMGQ